MAGGLVVAVVEPWVAEAEWPGLEGAAVVCLDLREVWGIRHLLVAATWELGQEECQHNVLIRAQAQRDLIQETLVVPVERPEMFGLAVVPTLQGDSIIGLQQDS